MKSREYGVIATFNGSYAFIKPDSGDRDLFCHSSELPEKGHIHRGQHVSYDVAPDKFKPGRCLARTVRFEGVNAQEAAEEEREQVTADYQREERTILSA